MPTPLLKRRLVAFLSVLCVAGSLAAASPAQAVPPAGVPTLLTPAQGETVPGNPVLSWEPLTGVSKYKVQVSTSPTFANTPLWSIDTLNITAAPPKELPAQQPIYWRVAGMNGSEVGPYAIGEFTRDYLDPPVLDEPADNATLEYPREPVVLRWSPVQGAKEYLVEIDDLPDFLGATSYKTDATSYSLTEPQTIGQTFYWRVQGLGTTTAASTRPSEARSYTLSWGPEAAQYVPVPTAPDDGELVTDVALRWNAVMGAAKYQLQVSPNGDWANNVTIDVTTTGTSYSPPATLNNAAYYWRVRALDAKSPAANNGGWSAERPFEPQFTRQWTDVPTLLSPDGVEVAAPDVLLQWTPIKWAAAYEVQVGTDANFSPRSFGSCTTTHTDWAPYIYETVPGIPFPTQPPASTGAASRCINIAGNSTYTSMANIDTWLKPSTADAPLYWRVKGLDHPATPSTSKLPVQGRWSATNTFWITAPPVPAPVPLDVVTPTAPDDCVPDVYCRNEQSTPLMRWEPVAGAIGYRVHVAIDPKFTNVQRVYQTKRTALRPYEALPDNQAGDAYYWFVQPCRTLTSGTLTDCGRFDDGVFDTARAFRKSSRPLTLEFPEDGATVMDKETCVPPDPRPKDWIDCLVFNWQAPSDSWVPSDANDDVEARTYRIQVSTTRDFTAIIDEKEVDQRTYTPYDRTYPVGGQLFWRVQAKDGTGNWLTFSETRQVVKVSEPLTATGPVNGAEVNDLPTLQWVPQVAAASYEVEVFKNGDLTFGGANKVLSQRTKLTAFVPRTALPPGTYAWRIRRLAVDHVASPLDKTREGPWNTGRTFTVVNRAPTLTAPSNGSIFVRDEVRLEWSPVRGSVTYQVQTSATPGFIKFIEDQSTVMTTWSPVKPYPNGTIYWRVLAKDARGAEIGTSADGNYVHDLTRPTASITAARPGAAAATLEWTATAAPLIPGGVTSFELSAYRGAVLEKKITVGGTLRKATVTGLVNNVAYQFTVTPHDSEGVGTQSAKSVAVTPRSIYLFTTLDRFIDRQHRDFYGRAPTPTELTSWRSRLQRGALGEQMVQELWVNPLHDNVVPPVTRLYSAFFGRIPDFGGTMYWAGKVRTGTSLTTVANNFAASSEFKTKYGSLSNRAYVELVYFNVLGRAGEAGGVTYWTQQLDLKRRNRGQVMIGFSESGEYKRKTFGQISAAVIYMDMLRRRPTIAERDAMATLINNAVVTKLDGTKDYNPALRAGALWMLGNAQYAKRAT